MFSASFIEQLSRYVGREVEIVTGEYGYYEGILIEIVSNDFVRVSEVVPGYETAAATRQSIIPVDAIAYIRVSSLPV
ncbi:hypothetical protein [Bacillus mesophilum]|uniref:DUF2642 domain-containing protein n=1 Tax=Bacillus mesophilum TaxID=1071718 RepID=A0A7V7RQI3_9BACI|nr:hypothetical protein [Bacillus mesophilum]KAB2335705.1 hypothetical protein F7732_03820 [Bacillus mesophilum]